MRDGLHAELAGERLENVHFGNDAAASKNVDDALVFLLGRFAGTKRLFTVDQSDTFKNFENIFFVSRQTRTIGEDN